MRAKSNWLTSKSYTKMESGTALLPLRSYDFTGTNFSYVASHLGCGNLSAAGELDCMRRKPVNDIVDFVGHYSDNDSVPALSFAPIPDEKLIFSNYSDRYSKGLVAKVPAIVGTALDEGTVLVPYAEKGVNETLADLTTLIYFLCPAHTTSHLRTQLGLRTYRYQYAGNFSNLSPLPWLGAYHSSDIPMFFGTYRDSFLKVPEFESSVSETMQDFLLAFMLDPLNGPMRKGWLEYTEGWAVRFGGDEVPASLFKVNDIDKKCAELGLT